MDNVAAVLYAPYDMRIEGRPIPQPGPNEVLVRVRSVGVCGSDVHYYEHGRIGSFVVEKPLVLGHESSGTIAQVGKGVPDSRLEERVAIEPGFPCGRCRECYAGRYNLCPYVRFYGTPPVDGAFTQYVLAPADFAHPIPSHLSDDAAALIEPLSVGLWACRKARLQGGEHVLVTGAGPIGILAMSAAFALGAVEVTVTDVSPERLRRAERLGATRIVNVRETALERLGLDADVLIECSGTQSALMDGILSLRHAATAVIVGMGPGSEATVPMAWIQNREITLAGVFRYSNTYRDAIAIAASGKVNLDAVVTGHYSLEQTEVALQSSSTDPGNIKSVVTP